MGEQGSLINEPRTINKGETVNKDKYSTRLIVGQGESNGVISGSHSDSW